MSDKIKQYAISLENDIFINIRKVARAITNFYDKKLFMSEISSTQFIALLKISCLENKSLSNIARNLSVDRTTLLRNLTLLQKKELLKIKNLSDKRAKTCFLTEKGAEAIEKGIIIFEKSKKEVEDILGVKKCELLSNDLKFIETTIKDLINY